MVDKDRYPVDLEQSKQDGRLLVQVSWLYYIEGLTQKQIADRLGFSRIKVNRMLSKARDTGIVEIRINTTSGLYVEMENQVCQLFGLKDARIVPDNEPGESTYLSLAQGIADWLTSRLDDNLIIGFGMGRTISHLPMVFRLEQKVDCTFTEISGGAANFTGSFEQYSVISRMAELAGGRASYFNTPTIVSNASMREAFLSEESINQTLELARSCDISIQSVGLVQKDALLRTNGHLTDDDLDYLRQHGAVGDVVCHYIDAQGNPVPSPLEDRIMGVSLDDLRQMPLRVGVGDVSKFEVLRAALHAGIFNVLIIDVSTAQKLIDSATSV